MKRTGILLCCLLLLLLCAACGNHQNAALTVNGTPVSQGVFAYYQNEVRTHPDRYEISADDDAAVQTAAETLCKQAVALDQYLESHHIPLSVARKSEIAETTKSLWSLFSAHYRALGMTKPDLTNVMTTEAQKKELLQYFYGPGGKHEVDELTLKRSFVELFVGFKAFEGALTKQNADGETVAMTDEEKQMLTEQFTVMARRANEGTDLDDLYEEYCAAQGLIVTNPLPVILMKDGDPMYDDDFFGKVNAISHGSTGVIVSEKSVYLLQRVTIATADEDAFNEYRDVVLEHEKMPAIEKKVRQLGEKAKLS